MKNTISIKLEENLLNDLDRFAKELGKTRASLIETAIYDYFDTLDEVISDKRIDLLKNSKNQKNDHNN